ncbi:MAG: DNA mismatch repair endonuclease MutL [Bacteroidales bacterium]|nr:DNA mismatch repair endonuclease MutL [Bacteroidales bacterium]
MNSDVIRLLPDSVANQIAAGEVIQRPASVIKELVENAVDAGATAIQIILKDAGRTLIQVVDNGCGMSPTDARMAFERHATSKISSATDLYSLHTMGFRGEALPSVAAVAQIDLRTMRHDDTIGTRLLISESKFESQEPASCVPGTNLMVKNIFFHMPARRKFLKKDSIELSHILREFERLALVNTNIDFTLIHNDVTLHQFRAGTLKQRIGALFGKNLESQIAAVSTETSLVKIDGFVGLPRFAKKRGAQQFLFVNGRNMRHPFFHKAIMKCFEQLIAPDSQPSYFINFEVDPSTIDVNIHPQKHEIKFEHEQAIWQILEAAIRETLGKTQAAGALDFDFNDAPDIPVFDPAAEAAMAMPKEDFDDAFNPFKAAPAEEPAQHASASSAGISWRPSAMNRPAQDWDKLYESFNTRRESAYNEQPAAIPDEPEIFKVEADSPTCMQLQNSYIVTGTHSGLMVISQRRAHIRILFERYSAMLAEGRMASQTLIFPEDLEISASQGALLTELLPKLEDMGFGLTPDTATRWSIKAVPAPLASVNSAELLVSLIAEAESNPSAAESLSRPLAAAMARSAAIKAQQPLSAREAEAIVADLFRCAEPSYTPDGLPVMTLIATDDIVSRLNPAQ